MLACWLTGTLQSAWHAHNQWPRL